MTLRIEVDRDKCEGLGMCEAMANDFFELDDDEVMHVLNETPADAERGHVTRGCAGLSDARAESRRLRRSP